MKTTETMARKLRGREDTIRVEFANADHLTVETVCEFVRMQTIARRKHPVFAARFYDPSTADVKSARQMMHELQKNNNEAERRNRHNAIDIIMKELVEAFIAYVDGDLGQCISELNQLGGCVASAVRMVRNEKHKKEQNHAQAQAQNHPGEHGRKERPFRPHR